MAIDDHNHARFAGEPLLEDTPTIGGNNIGPDDPIPQGFRVWRVHGPSGIRTIGPLMAYDMTMRDAFAVRAMAAIALKSLEAAPMEGVGAVPLVVAITAYQFADAMIAARSA